MPALDKTGTATWVRVRLTDDRSPALTEGELVLRADRVAVGDEHLAFYVADEVAYRLERRYFKALTWFVDRPTFGEWLKARRAQHPNSHRRWTDAESQRLREEIAAGLDWPRIAEAHGRTVSAVQRQATLPPPF
jgi:hypothetical protein